MQLEPHASQALSIFGLDAFADAANASPEALRDLQRFEELLQTASLRFNLVGPSVLADFWLRHVYDSAQLLDVAPNARVWADLGAGAGFPGIVLAVLLKGTPGAVVHLVDSLAKRTRFLSDVVSQLDLPAIVHTARAEDVAPPANLDVVTARACAPLSRLLSYAQSYVYTGATGLFLKGRAVEQELSEARRSWTFNAVLHQSATDPSGRIVEIQGLARA